MDCTGLADNALSSSTLLGTAQRACKQSSRVSRRNKAASELLMRPLAVSVVDDSYRSTQCGATPSGVNPGGPGQRARKQMDGAIDPFATMEEYEDGPLDKCAGRQGFGCCCTRMDLALDRHGLTGASGIA